jgi:hypothetical protein
MRWPKQFGFLCVLRLVSYAFLITFPRLGGKNLRIVIHANEAKSFHAGTGVNNPCVTLYQGLQIDANDLSDGEYRPRRAAKARNSSRNSANMPATDYANTSADSSLGTWIPSTQPPLAQHELPALPTLGSVGNGGATAMGYFSRYLRRHIHCLIQ